MIRAVTQPVDEQGDPAPRTIRIFVVFLPAKGRGRIQQVFRINIGAHLARCDRCVQQCF